MAPRPLGLILAPFVTLAACFADPGSGDDGGDGNGGTASNTDTGSGPDGGGDGGDDGDDGGDGTGTSMGGDGGTSDGDDGGTSGDGGTSDDGGSTGGGTDTGDGGTSDDGGSTGGGTTTEPPVEPSAVLFVNFDGPMMQYGPEDDSSQNQTQFSMYAVDYAAYGSQSMQDAIMARVRQHFAPFNVLVTAQRPPMGDYTMVVVSPTNPTPGGGTLGISSLDCGNMNPRNNSFAFLSPGDHSIDVQANVISSGVGLTFGLERLSDDTAGDLMEPYAVDETRDFVDACLDLRTDIMPTCTVRHSMFCSDGKQNSHAELMDLFGPP